jgi:hypothetical protein
MNWKRRNTISSYLSSSLWIIPIGAVILEQILSPIVRPIDARLSWSGLGLRIEGGARSLQRSRFKSSVFRGSGCRDPVSVTLIEQGVEKADLKPKRIPFRAVLLLFVAV